MSRIVAWLNNGFNFQVAAAVKELLPPNVVEFLDKQGLMVAYCALLTAAVFPIIVGSFASLKSLSPPPSKSKSVGNKKNDQL